jgi:aspartyl-tRNA synthetase
MAESLDDALKRTHDCGELRASDVGTHVRLCGWVRSYRDHGGVVFIDLRDREGITQIVYDPSDNQANHALARTLRNEWVISAAGTVRPRGEDRVNPKLPTGEIEVIADDLVVLNRARTAPFEPDAEESAKVAEEMRLRYRSATATSTCAARRWPGTSGFATPSARRCGGCWTRKASSRSRRPS